MPDQAARIKIKKPLRVPKSSSYDVPELWRRIELTNHDLIAIKNVLTKKIHTSLGLRFLYEEKTHLGRNWGPRLGRREGDQMPSLLLVLGEEYDFRESYKQSRKTNQLALSPHGAFLQLAPSSYTRPTVEDHCTALAFLKRWGPLNWGMQGFDLDPEIAHWVHLSEFWAHHARFKAIAELWSAVNTNDLPGLLKAIMFLESHKAFINQVRPLLGSRQIPTDHEDPHSTVEDIEVADLPPEYIAKAFLKEKFLSKQFSRKERLIFFVRRLIQHELTEQVRHASPRWVVDASEKTRYVLRPTLQPPTLLAAMWEFMGLDHWQGLPPKRCVLDNKLFFPRTVRSQCCSVAEDRRWSKRQSSRRARADMKKNKYF